MTTPAMASLFFSPRGGSDPCGGAWRAAKERQNVRIFNDYFA